MINVSELGEYIASYIVDRLRGVGLGSITVDDYLGPTPSQQYRMVGCQTDSDDYQADTAFCLMLEVALREIVIFNTRKAVQFVNLDPSDGEYQTPNYGIVYTVEGLEDDKSKIQITWCITNE